MVELSYRRLSWGDNARHGVPRTADEARLVQQEYHFNANPNACREAVRERAHSQG
jgi:hypothetical protein